MKLPCTSIAALATLILLVGVNLALLRNIVVVYDNEVVVTSMGILVMANVLVFGCRCLFIRKDRSQTFLIGFELAGLVAVLAYVAFCRHHTEWLLGSLLIPLSMLGDPYLPNSLKRDFHRGSPYALVLIWTYMIVIPSVFLAIPQIVFAVVGGMSARLRSRIARRVRGLGVDVRSGSPLRRNQTARHG